MLRAWRKILELAISSAIKTMTLDLFTHTQTWSEVLSDNAIILRQFAIADANILLSEIAHISSQSPFRQMQTLDGFTMSAAMTACGVVGWISDRKGYRYSSVDPLIETAWPALPLAFKQLAQRAAMEAGFISFEPDVCLINRYTIGAKMSLHQDRDELDFNTPIVSISLGLPATFLWGGLKRSDTVKRVTLQHGDVVVWGGTARLHFHGIAAIQAGHHPLVGEQRINLTFRKAL